jgi:hypothetical protein
MKTIQLGKFDDVKLLKTVKGFRKGILDRRKPNLMCYAVCAPLHCFLKMGGIASELKEVCVVQGPEVWFHWYLELPDGRILDPTASQFKTPTGDQMPEIYLGERPSWYQMKKDKRKRSPI